MKDNRQIYNKDYKNNKNQMVSSLFLRRGLSDPL